MSVFDYSKKFRALPSSLKQMVSKAEFMERIAHLEDRFQIQLGRVVLRLLTDDLNLKDLNAFLEQEHGMDTIEAKKLKIALFNEIINPLSQELQKKGSVSKEGEDGGWFPMNLGRPLNLKDIFEGKEGGMPESSFDVQDLVVDVGEIRKEAKAKEEHALTEIVSKVTIVLSDDQKKKLKDVFRSRLKNVRDAVDTRLALSRPLDAGGVGLTDVEASDTSIMVENYLKNNWPPKLSKEEEEAALKKVKSELQPSEKIIETAFAEPKIPEAPAKEEPWTVDKARRAVLETIGEEKDVEKGIKENPAEILKVEPSPARTAERERTPFHLVGPLEEISLITIDDWRSIYTSTAEAVSKTKEKIEELGKESFKKKIEGIKAWQKGAIARLYIEIGKESMEKNETIAKISNERQGKNAPYLTEEEFQAIMDLSRELRSLA